jgi:hypothetical protein
MDDLRSGIERWTNEGGHIGTEATSRYDMRAGHDASMRPLDQSGQAAGPSESSSSRPADPDPAPRSP